MNRVFQRALGWNLLVAASWAQNAPPATIRAETNAVEVDVAVRDSKGRPVEDLTRQNFRIADEGKPRPIQIFSFNGSMPAGSAANAPVALASARPLPPGVFSNRNVAPVNAAHSTVILLDGLNGWVENYLWSRQAVVSLMDKVPADEQIAVYALVQDVGLVVLQDYTADRDRLLKNVSTYVARKMRPAPPGVEGPPPPPPLLESRQPPPPKEAPRAPNAANITGREADLEVRLDSEDVRKAFQALAARLAAIPGPKSVFWLTQGFPTRLLRDLGKPAWDQTLTALNEANVSVSPVDNNGAGGPRRRWGLRSDLLQMMQQVADRTGGTAYFGRNDLDNMMAEGIAAARASYSLGFYLADEERDGKFHRLTVSTDRPQLDLDYRRGYYAGAAPLPGRPERKMPLETALLSPMDLQAVSITAKVAPPAGGKLRVNVNLDIATLALQQLGGNWRGKVEEALVEFDADGRQVAKVSGTHEFQFPESARAAYQRGGVLLLESVPLAAGATKLSIVVRDSATGKVGSLTVPLDRAGQ